MRVRGRILPAVLLGAALLAVAAPSVARGADDVPKVAIIVGPVGERLTPVYIGLAELAADAAVEGGAQVVRAYSPNATPERVLAAVADANIVVYFGHGTGYRGPGTSFDPLVANGWGLQGPRAEGTHEDSWVNGTLKYYGEAWIAEHARPAPGFVMIYSNACYAPGAPDGTVSAPPPQEAIARAGFYSRGVLEAGASAYYATDFYAGAARLVTNLLAHPNATYGDIFRGEPNFQNGDLKTIDHPFVDGRELWLHKSPYFHGQVNYWYAFAGDPEATPAGSGVDSRRIKFDPKRGIQFLPGRHTGYRFSADGEVVETRAIRLVRRSVAPAGGRARIPDQDGYWFAITDGRLDGFYVRESADVHLPGVALRTRLEPSRPVEFEAGEHTGYRFSKDGTVAAEQQASLSRRSTATARARAVINGERHVLIDSGALDGYWVPESSAIRLLPPRIPELDAPDAEPAREVGAETSAAAEQQRSRAPETGDRSSSPVQSPRPTPSPTPSPSASGSPTPAPTPAPTPSPSGGSTAEPSPTPSPSAEPSPSPTPTPEPTPSPEPSPTPTPTPTPTPEPTPTPSPTRTPPPGKR